MRARVGWLLIVVLACFAVAGNAAAADVKAELISPTPGTNLGASATFTWSPGSGSAEYSLAIGSSLGGSNVYNQSQGLNTSVTVATLPAGGGTLYVRLYTRFLTTGWQFIDYTFTAMAGAKAELTTPTPGTNLGASATFTWSPGIGAAEYSLAIGSSVGGSNVYNQSQGLNTSVTVATLPAGGGTLYVRLYTRFLTAGWQFTDYTFTAMPGAKAELTTPAAGSTLASNATFT